MSTISTVTLYDLMAEDLDIWVTKDKQFGFNLEIDNENGDELIRDTIHPCAADSFADFCKRYLAAYENASQLEVA